MRDMQKTYDECAELLELLAKSQRQHEAVQPGCEAKPLCVGPTAMLTLAAGIGSDPRLLADLVLTAVGEINRGKVRENGLRERLEVQRGLAADLNTTVEGLTDQLAETEAKVGGLEAEIGRLQGELDSWDDVADIVGPVLPVAPEVES